MYMFFTSKYALPAILLVLLQLNGGDPRTSVPSSIVFKFTYVTYGGKLLALLVYETHALLSLKQQLFSSEMH
jgi:hypothetical protein